MKLKLLGLKLDLGTTPVENLFFNTYLTLADGAALKVYLYGYKHAYEKSDLSMDEERLARELGLSVEEVTGAIEYWIREGVIERHVEDDEPVYAIKSLRQRYLDSLQEATDHSLEAFQQQSETAQRIHHMFERIEEILGLPLTPNEVIRIQEAREEYAMEPDLMVEAFRVSAEEMGKRNLNYVLGIARNWHLDNIRSLTDLEQSKEKKKATRKRQYKSSGVKLPKDDRMTKEDLEALLKRKLQKDIKSQQGE